MSAYGPLCTEYYDLDKPVPPPAPLAWYLAQARAAGGPVLEPMCGSGRYLLPLRAAGIEIHGTDTSAAMLAACQRRLREAGLQALLRPQGLAGLAMAEAPYGLAFIPSGSIGLIMDEAELDAGLAALRRHLVPGGRLLLELLVHEPSQTGEAQAWEEPAREVRGSDGLCIRYRGRVQLNAQPPGWIFRGRYEKYRHDQLLAQEDEVLALRRHEPADFVARLQRGGWQEVQVHGADSLHWLAGAVVLEARA